MGRCVGVFDSGLGGLSVYREIKKLLPSQKVIYLADHKNAPYGTKKQAEIKKLTVNSIRFLLSRGCDPIVIACNTATTGGMEYYRKKFPGVVFVGVVPPIKPAAKFSKNKKIIMLSTQATSKSKYLRDLINEFAPDCLVWNFGCSELVRAVESGQTSGEKTGHALRKYLEKPLKDGADAVVLGCTHFPFLTAALRKIVGGGVRILEPSFPVARQVLNLYQNGTPKRGSLVQNNNKKLTLKRGKFVVLKDEFYTSGDAQNASRVASKLLKRKIIFRDAC